LVIVIDETIYIISVYLQPEYQGDNNGSSYRHLQISPVPDKIGRAAQNDFSETPEYVDGDPSKDSLGGAH
jgi:hypothetical protein